MTSFFIKVNWLHRSSDLWSVLRLLSSSRVWVWWQNVCSLCWTVTTCSPPSLSWRTKTRWCGSSAGPTSTPSSPSSSTWCCRSSSPSSRIPTRPSRYRLIHLIWSGLWMMCDGYIHFRQLWFLIFNPEKVEYSRDHRLTWSVELVTVNVVSF